jgi:hypothetical protein
VESVGVSPIPPPCILVTVLVQRSVSFRGSHFGSRGSWPEVPRTCRLNSATSRCFPCRIGGSPQVRYSGRPDPAGHEPRVRKLRPGAQQIDPGRVHVLT